MTASQLVPASRFPLAEVAALMNRGYADYYTPIDLDEAAFFEMVRLQDIALEESPVETRDGVPVGLALLGLRRERGWIGGLAVPPEERRRGAGRRLMLGALERAAARGARNVDLEVLVQNEPAIPLYRSLGFRDTRRFGVFVRPAPAPAPQPGVPLAAEAPLAAAPGSPAHEASVAECMAHIAAGGALAPPWQRARVVVERGAATCIALGVRSGGTLVASAIVRSNSSRAAILHLVAEAGAAPEAIGELIGAIVARFGDGAIGFLNHPEGNPVEDALLGAGFGVPFRQREMRLTF